MRVQMVRGEMLDSCLASFGGRTVRSSLQIGAISTEYVYLKLAVLEWVSEDSSCSEAFDLNEFRDK